MKKKTNEVKGKYVVTPVRKNTSIRLSDDDQLHLDRLRSILSPMVRLSDNKVISAALKIADEKLSKGGK